jgi:hypothetical protein
MEKQIFTVVDKITGQEYRAQFEGNSLAENEMIVPELRTEPMDNPYFDFESREFYNKTN